MKKLYVLTMALVAMIMTVSCSKSDRAAGYIPKDACVVASINGSGWLKAYKDASPEEMWDLMKASIEKELGSESNEVMPYLTSNEDFIKGILKDPESIGIQWGATSYAYFVPQKDDMVLGVVIPINAKKLDSFIDKVCEMANAKKENVMEMFTKCDDYQFAEVSRDFAMAISSKVAVLIFSDNSNATRILKDNMNLSKSASILSDKGFIDFQKKSKDINLWISSNIIDWEEIADDRLGALLRHYEKITGVDLHNNYGQVILGAREDGFDFSISLYTNKTFNRKDAYKKLKDPNYLEEIQKWMVEFFDWVGLSGFSPFYPDRYEEPIADTTCVEVVEAAECEAVDAEWAASAEAY